MAVFNWGFSSGNWSDPTKWRLVEGADADGVPDADDAVIFDNLSDGLSTVDAAFGGAVRALSLGGAFEGSVVFSDRLTVHENASLWLNDDFSSEMVVGGALTLGLGSGGFRASGRFDVGGALRLGDLFGAFDGVINASGDIIVTGSEPISGQGKILIHGSGDQTLSGQSTSGASRLPEVEIDKPAGTLTLENSLAISDWTYTRGHVDAGESLVYLLFDDPEPQLWCFPCSYRELYASCTRK
jgi:hypothetical protein